MSEKTKIKSYDQLRITKTDAGWEVVLYGKDSEGNKGFSGRMNDRATSFDGIIDVIKTRYDVS